MYTYSYILFAEVEKGKVCAALLNAKYMLLTPFIV